MVEGAQRPTPIDDSESYALEIPKHLDSRNSQHRETKLVEPPIARLIPCRPISHRMDFPVHLDAQPRFQARKVEDVASLGMLAPELEPANASPQLAPKQHFRQRHRSPQLARFLYRLDRCGENIRAPSTPPLRGAVRSLVERFPGAFLDCRGQSNPTSPVPGRN
jgi:hypothetical protein